MNIILLVNDDVSYSSLLAYPTLKHFSKYISGIFVQDGILNSENSSSDIFNKVKKKSGFRYAQNLVLEILSYKIAILVRNLFRMNKHEDDCYVETNAKLGKIFNIPVFQIKGSIHDKIWLEKIIKLKPDLVICIRYAEILKKSLLEIPDKGVINFHPSLLPKYKGLGPVFQAFAHDEKEIGFSFHYINENIDEGEIITQKKIKIKKNDSVSRLTISAHVLGGFELLSIIKTIENNTVQTLKKLKTEENYFSWPEKEQVKIFFKSNKKYISVRDFFSLVFYNPKNFCYE
jgi:folate-dependent phosphoribosylglycinamide formyltransferase PurN